MRSPRDMQIIQIDITNACVHECSNCTRFCGHHKKPFFMDFETFKRAVQSLKDFKGTIGVMGGEPTLHPEFERFVNYLHDNIQYNKISNDFVRPVEDFMGKMQQQEIENWKIHKNVYGKNKGAIYGAGLWSAMPAKYYENYELIQDVFKMQALNDHRNPMYHSPILFSRKDMGINDEDWLKLRDDCWAQKMWSASVTPKGAFFCEIAASLDMLFDGPGGIPIEHGWWMKDPEEFNQYNWCELCGIAFAPFSRDAREEIDDMSSSILEKLKQKESPKVLSGRYSTINFDGKGKAVQGVSEGWKSKQHTNAWNNFSDRMNEENDVLHPKRLVGLVQYKKDIENIVKNSKQFDLMVIAIDKFYIDQIKKYHFNCPVEFVIVEPDLGYGKILNLFCSETEVADFLILHEEKMILANDFRERIIKRVLNPGTLIWGEMNMEDNVFIENAELLSNADIILFSRRALSFKGIGFDGIAACSSVHEFIEKWDENKVIPFIGETFIDNFPKIEPHKKYAVYGTGVHGENITKRLADVESEVLWYCDSNTDKWGNRFHMKEVISPKDCAARKNQVDKIIIASDSYGDILHVLGKYGVKKDECIINAF